MKGTRWTQCSTIGLRNWCKIWNTTDIQEGLGKVSRNLLNGPGTLTIIFSLKVKQCRQDGSVDFFLGWQDYLDGFGSAAEEYWLGESVDKYI